MPTATMTTKGQITIPAAVRAALGIEAGDRVEFVPVEPGRFEIYNSQASTIFQYR
ncbi:MAG: AbrB/MazE/SpoVT family DNA-binding domain-containing protein [Gammaproteobacteria bacterium]|nr:AbrB/MazE/SpoVT family DNA-binding domain-containing protein [Gammaproteobacteria bacterium]